MSVDLCFPSFSGKEVWGIRFCGGWGDRTLAFAPEQGWAGHRGLQKSHSPKQSSGMRGTPMRAGVSLYCREELPMPRRDQKKPKAICGWSVCIVGTRVFILFYLFYYCLVFVKTTARPQSGQFHVSSRLVGNFGQAATLELVDGQRFDWIGHLLAFSCWRTLL